jgi:hypothetical protein
MARRRRRRPGTNGGGGRRRVDGIASCSVRAVGLPLLHTSAPCAVSPACQPSFFPFCRAETASRRLRSSAIVFP